MTVGALSDTIEAKTRPVRRSTHIGNQPPAELAIMAGLPNGVDIVMVDTIQGSDRYSSPNVLRFGSHAVPLLSKNHASKKVVGSLVVPMEAPASLAGKKLSDIHNRALGSLMLTNTPAPMMEAFSKHPDIVNAVMQACSEAGEVQRKVLPGGAVSFGEEVDINRDGIFGLNGATTGAMLPLNGMMVTDALITHAEGADGSLQLAGPDMIKYTADPDRMGQVARRIDEARGLLGISPFRQIYEVVSIAALTATVKSQSQHELLVSSEEVDLSAHRELILAGAA